MKYLVVSLLLIFTNLSQAQKVVGPAGEPAFDASRTLEQALDQSGDNRESLENALDQAAKDQRSGLEFLIRYMPVTDLQSLSAEFLLNNLKFAYRARNDQTWAKEVPTDIFLNDVLPYASLDVRRDDWRKDFYERFSPKVKAAEKLRQAVNIVNQSVRDELKVDYSTKRKKPDQSPYESMESGLASCTGLSVLLCDALRSVGIPARIAGIPSWTTKPGNHNWVEFYDPATKNWHFIEYYPDAKGIDHSWFLPDAARANGKSFYHAIYATSWKPTGRNFPMVWNMKSNTVPGLNVTERYLEIANSQGIDLKSGHELRIEYLDQSGQRQGKEVALKQLDKVIAKGTTPTKTDDKNQFLSFSIDQKQRYQIEYRNNENQLVRQLIEPQNAADEKQFSEIILR